MPKEGYVVHKHVDKVCGRRSVDHNSCIIDGGHMKRRDLGEEMDVWKLFGRKGVLYPPRWRPAASTHGTVPATHLALRARACHPHARIHDENAVCISPSIGLHAGSHGTSLMLLRACLGTCGSST